MLLLWGIGDSFNHSYTEEVIVIVKTEAGKQQLLRLLQEHDQNLEEIVVDSRKQALELGLSKLA